MQGLVMNEEEMLAGAAVTSCGYFVLAIPQCNAWQGFFVDKVMLSLAGEVLVKMVPANMDDEERLQMLARSLARYYLDNDPTGEPHRRAKHNQNVIGLLGAAIARLTKTNYFWIEITVEPPTESHTEVFHPVSVSGDLKHGRNTVLSAVQPFITGHA